jgi:hypothetical protein
MKDILTITKLLSLYGQSSPIGKKTTIYMIRLILRGLLRRMVERPSAMPATAKAPATEWSKYDHPTVFRRSGRAYYL